MVTSLKGTKPFGAKRRKLNEEDVLWLCQSFFAFDCALVAAAIGTILFHDDEGDGNQKHVKNFQKSLKYGLADALTISCYELGFTDRCIAQNMTSAVRKLGYRSGSFRSAIANHRDVIQQEIVTMPTYFSEVLQGH